VAVVGKKKKNYRARMQQKVPTQKKKDGIDSLQERKAIKTWGSPNSSAIGGLAGELRNSRPRGKKDGCVKKGTTRKREVAFSKKPIEAVSLFPPSKGTGSERIRPDANLPVGGCKPWKQLDT